jgi:hypothetical protein
LFAQTVDQLLKSKSVYTRGLSSRAVDFISQIIKKAQAHQLLHLNRQVRVVNRIANKGELTSIRGQFPVIDKT